MTRDAHEHEHEHHAPGPPRAAAARRDLLGLAALLGPDSGLVPISDLDAGAAWPEACESFASRHAPSESHPPAQTPVHPATCGSCTTRCAPAVQALGHAHPTERSP